MEQHGCPNIKELKLPGLAMRLLAAFLVWCCLLDTILAFRPANHHGSSSHAAIAHNNLLEVIITGLPPRILPNVSLGLNYHFETEGRQCNLANNIVKKRGEDGVPRMTYSPNRRHQSQTISDTMQQRLKLAVVLAVGGHSDSHYNYGPGGSVNGLMSVWDSWLEYFFSPSSNTTSLVLLFDERDFRRQNITNDKNEYLDTILLKNMGAELVDCAHVRNRHHGVKTHLQHGYGGNPGVMLTTSANKINGSATVTASSVLGCSPNLPLDSGYRVYFIDIANSNYTRSYSLKGETEVRSANYDQQRPLLIFATVHSFPKPSWAEKEDEDELFKNWKPFRLNRRYPTNYGYTKMTNWYSYYMLRLQLLDYFDYAAKLDNDVSFVAPFPMPNLPYHMAKGQHLMMMTTKDYYTDDPRISQGVNPCLQSFVHEEVKFCRLSKNDQEAHAIQIDYNPWTWVNMNQQNQLLRPGGSNDTTFFEKSMNLTFRAHFLVYWLGMYTAPETMYMAKYWNDWHPRGMWDFRWGDQQWWPRPIAMLGNGDLQREIWHATELESDNERYVVHKLWPRQGTVPKVQYYDPVAGTTRAERDSRYAVAAKPLIYR